MNQAWTQHRSCPAAMLLFIAMVAVVQAQQPLVDNGLLPDEYRTHVTADRKTYLPGELLFARATLLHYSTHAPLQPRKHAQAVIQICGPDGIAARLFTSTDDGQLGVRWAIPPQQRPGTYKVLVRYPWSNYPPAECVFHIGVPRPAVFDVALERFPQDLAPGQRVKAALTVRSHQGKPISSAQLRGEIRFGEAKVALKDVSTDVRGRCEFSFQAPAELNVDHGTLKLSISTQDKRDSYSRRFFVIPANLQVEMTPESGSLSVGLRSRVFVTTRTPKGRAVSLSGQIVDDKDEAVATFTTNRDGLGVFAVTPRKGQRLWLKPLIPKHLEGRYALPAPTAEAMTLQWLGNTTRGVRLSISSLRPRTVKIVLRQRNQDVADPIQLELSKGTAQIVVNPHRTAAGTFVAAVLDEKGRPIARRLVYHRSKKLDFRLIPTRGGKFTVHVTDEDKQPVAARLRVRVLPEKAEHGLPGLDIQALLQDDTDVLPTHLRDLLATYRDLDLLLGNQGWRRKAFDDDKSFVKTYGDAALRVLVQNRREQMARPGKIHIEYIPGAGIFILRGDAETVRAARQLIKGLDGSDSQTQVAQEDVIEVRVSLARMKLLEERRGKPLKKKGNERIEFTRELDPAQQPSGITPLRLWNALLKTNDKGIAKFSLAPNSKRRMIIDIDGVDGDGRIGHQRFSWGGSAIQRRPRPPGRKR